jgi:hypothetical protein
MALDNVDPNIALQAGRNIPQFGPDWQTVQNAQRTAISLQQAQQVQQAQNALRQTFADTNNWSADKGGIAVKPEAMAQLAQRSPAAFMDLSNNLATLNTKALQSQALQSNVMQDWIKRANDGGDSADDEYRAAIAEGVDPRTALARGQEAYTKAMTSVKASGMPQALQDMIPNTFDPKRVEQRRMTQEMRAAQEKEQTVPEYAVPMMVGGGATKDVPVVKSPDGKGFVTADPAHTPVTDLGGLHKIGSKEEGAASKELYTGQISDGKGGLKTVTVQVGQHGFVDPDTGDKITGVQNLSKVGAPSPFGSTMGNPDLKGDEFLKSLPAPEATQVKALAEGREPFPSGFSMARLQPLIQAVSQYDPNFDAVNYMSRYRTRQAFTSGQESRNITSLNTVIGHLDNLKQLGEALNNNDIPLANKVLNHIATAFGSSKVTNFDTAKNAVADELERTFRGTAGSVTGIKGWSEQLTSDASPEQQKGAWKVLGNLLDSRVDALGDTYSRGMGKTTDGLTLLSPKSQTAYEELTGRAPEVKTVGPTGKETTTQSEPKTTSPTTMPQPASSQGSGTAELPHPTAPEEANKLPVGTHYIGPDGKVWVR